MSQSFLSGDTVLWQPSTGVARLFARSVEAVSDAVGLPTGLGPEVSDEYVVDGVVFAAFVDATVLRYCASTHPVLRSLLESVAAIGVVLVERSGRTVPALDARFAEMETSDVAVTTSGFAAQGDAAHLRMLADRLAGGMSR